MAENEDRLQEGPNRFDRELEARLLRAQQSAGIAETVAAEFELPNGVCGVMTGDNQEEVLKRIEVLSDYYGRCRLTSETHAVLMPNGQTVADVPVNFTGQDRCELMDAALGIHDRQKDFSLSQILQSKAIQ